MTDGFTLKPEDEYPHPPGDASNFNESVYHNAFDPKTGFGGWVRLGNRVNEGYAEKSMVFYLPDGRLACAFERPDITDNNKFCAGGLEFDTHIPLQDQRMR